MTEKIKHHISEVGSEILYSIADSTVAGHT